MLPCQVEAHLLRGLLGLVARERGGEAVDRALAAALVRMLGDMGLYSSALAPRLLEETAAFYKDESQRLLESSDIPQYLCHCEVHSTRAHALALCLRIEEWVRPVA